MSKPAKAADFDKNALPLAVTQESSFLTLKSFKVNINQALKHKNALGGKLKVLDSRILQNGSWIKGNTPSYNMEELITERSRTMVDLIQLKAKISRATQPVVDKILEMSELKSYVNVLKSLDVKRGIKSDRYSRMESSTTEYESSMTEKEKDGIVEKVESQISKLQDELDSFNATTEI